MNAVAGQKLSQKEQGPMVRARVDLSRESIQAFRVNAGLSKTRDRNVDSEVKEMSRGMCCG